MITKLVVLLSVIVLTVTNCIAQTKYEKEYRLHQTEVPKKALDFVEKLGIKNKIKWYKEEGLDNTSIESKTKYLSKKYSIEFTSKGEIEDIEVQIKFKELPFLVRQNILKYLNANYQKVKIYKTQIQFSGNPKLLLNHVTQQVFKNNTKITTRYELIVKTKTADKYQKFEFLFNNKGDILSKALILLKNTDNLEY